MPDANARQTGKTDRPSQNSWDLKEHFGRQHLKTKRHVFS
jgi:hypothetical protein